MIKLKTKKYNAISIVKHPKYLLYHQIHKCKYLTGEDISPSIKQQIIEQGKFILNLL